MKASESFTKFINVSGKENFGNINRNKNKILARLKGIQNFPHYTHSSFLQNLEEDLIKDYTNILKLEEDYWRIRSRIN